MENLCLLHDTYYKGDFYLSITINGMGDLKLCIYIYKYIEVKTFFLFFFIMSTIYVKVQPQLWRFQRGND